MPKAKPNRAKLTEARCKSEAYSSGTHYLWDTEVRGLALRVYPSGSKSWFYSFVAPGSGKRRFMALGDYPSVTVKDARAAARIEAAKVSKGTDPLDEREAERAALAAQERADTTLAEFVEAWLATGGRKPNKRSYKSSKTHRADEARLRKRVLPELGSRSLQGLTTSDLKRLHGKIAKRGGYEANRVLELLRKIFNDAMDPSHPLVNDAAPFLTVNPARGSWRSHKAENKGHGVAEESRTVTLTAEGLARFARAVDALDDPYARAALWLLILTGARSASELLRLRWSDVDLDRKVVTFYQQKTGKRNPLPLSDAACKILEGLPREANNPHVFPGRRSTNRTGHRTTLRNHWDQVREAADLGDVTLHDLRRTAGSILASSGFSLHQIGAILGHQSEDVTNIYAVVSGESKRTAVDALGAAVEAVRGSEQPQEPATAPPGAWDDPEALRARLAALEADDAA